MINLYEQICRRENLRIALRQLYEKLSDQKQKRELAYLLGGDFRVFSQLLTHEDPKVRRLAALLLGQMETEDVLPELMQAWKTENTLFVRYAYPEAMLNLDVSSYLEELRKMEQKLLYTEVDETSGPHIRLELLKLHELLLPYEESTHTLRLDAPADKVILICPSGCAQLTAEQIHIGNAVAKGSAVHVENGDWTELLKIRTWSSLLLPLSVCSSASLPADPILLGRALGTAGIAEYLDMICSGRGRWRYRLDMQQGKADGRGIRTIAGEIARASKGRLVNDPGGYELTIRLLPRRDGNYAGFLKLEMLPDHRFAYRKEFIPDSMTGVTAACVAAISSRYLDHTAKANVLDPFCGVGTLLLERKYLNAASQIRETAEAGSSLDGGDGISLYGTDMNGEAIEKGRQNAGRARIPVHFIHRDFFDFKHDHLFDEVITDVPRIRKDGDIRNTAACRKMFRALPSLLKKGAIVTVYTLDAEDTKRSALAADVFSQETCVTLNEKSGASVFVFRYKG